MSFPITMNTNGLIAPAGIIPLPINTNGHLCIRIDYGSRGIDEPHRQRILEDDKIILRLIMKFMEKISHVVS